MIRSALVSLVLALFSFGACATDGTPWSGEALPAAPLSPLELKEACVKPLVFYL